MKKFFIAGYYGFKNLGDELLLYKIIQDILNIVPQAQFYIWSADKEFTKGFLRDFPVVAVNRFSPEETILAIKASDVVILGGGGLIQEYYGIKVEDLFQGFGMGVPAYAVCPLLAKIFNKKVFYWCIGHGPVVTQDAILFSKWFYSLSDIVTLRDEQSYCLVKNLVAEKNVFLDTDPLLNFDFKKFSSQTKKNVLGVSIRRWFNDEKLTKKVLSAIKRLIETNKSVQILPIPCDLNLDVEVMNRFAKELPEENLFNIEIETIEDIIKAISVCNWFVGMRLHSLVCAYKLKKPFLAISYDAKTEEFVKLVNAQSIKTTQLSEEELFTRLKKLINSAELKQKSIEYKTPQIFKAFINDDKLPVLQEIQVSEENIYFDDFVKTLMLEREGLYETVTHKQTQIEQLKSQNESILNQLNQIISEKDALNSQLTQIISEKDALNSQLTELLSRLNNIYSSDFWKVASVYYRLKERSILVKSIHSVLRFIKHSVKFIFTVKKNQKDHFEELQNAKKTQKDHFEELQKFITKNTGKLIYIVYSGVRYTDTEGQRSVRLSQSLAELGIKVIFVYWNWGENDKDVYEEVSDKVFVMPRDDFLNKYKEIFKLLQFFGNKNTILIELPDPGIIPVLLEANSLNFVTIYDMLDDWEEFNKVGQAVWYEKKSELFILRNTMYRFAVTNSLREKYQEYEIYLLPNGFSPEKLTDKPCLKVEKGEITIGYFGHLTEGWFDWDLLLETAKRNTSFMFHIIGYGMPNSLKLPQNIKYFGKVSPENLSSFVKNWDVCIIPFKDFDLSKSVDPIKLYEYLYFKKPVVVTGLPHLVGFPYLIYSQNNSESFREAIIKAKNIIVENDKVDEFLNDKTWLERTKNMLKVISGV